MGAQVVKRQTTGALGSALGIPVKIDGLHLITARLRCVAPGMCPDDIRFLEVTRYKVERPGLAMRHVVRWISTRDR